jgi:hypothetical protein
MYGDKDDDLIDRHRFGHGIHVSFCLGTTHVTFSQPGENVSVFAHDVGMGPWFEAASPTPCYRFQHRQVPLHKGSLRADKKWRVQEAISAGRDQQLEKNCSAMEPKTGRRSRGFRRSTCIVTKQGRCRHLVVTASSDMPKGVRIYR